MSFNALRYIASYPDLIAAFGLDTAAATVHYNTVGIFEGRVESFDALRYVASNPDLIAVFGLDTTAAIRHYIVNGFAEGRQTSFDALRYIASNPDLIGAFGTNTTAATTHYIGSGFTEGRQINFDALRYIASNSDLIILFGLNTTGATTDYITNGFSKGRPINFDGLRYIASNPDLIAAFGTNALAATQHYIGSGLSEGRNTSAFDPEVYLRNYPDLRGAFGSDTVAATQHYIVAGAAEGRRTSAFTVDLSTIALGSGGFVIRGQCANDAVSGASVSLAGDVNGDGLDDLIVGGNVRIRFGQNNNSGRAYVVFGSTQTAAIDLSTLAGGTGGFMISGQCVGDVWGASSVAAAGDINGDGLMDLLVGAHRSDPLTGADAGRSYVIYGRTATTSISLSAVAAGSGGFIINGHCAYDYSGRSLSSAGDVNGDGLSDLIVGADGGDPGMRSNAGRSYVIFGSTGSTAINLSTIAAGQGGFVINGRTVSGGQNVAGAGDVNGDGLADLVIAAPGDTPAGRSYVVFGRTATASVDLSTIAEGTGGFVIVGQCDELSGRSIAGAGDINGDGLADLIVGAGASSVASQLYGQSYVVFGKTGTAAISLSDVDAGTGGFVIKGQCGGSSGISVSTAGDVNGDGLADLIVGARDGDNGRSFLVLGKASGSPVNLTAVRSGLGGFAINGMCNDQSGQSVSAAGDVNGDGLADLIVGAPGKELATVFPGPPGRSYVVFGNTTGVFNQSFVDQLGDANANTLNGSPAAETLVGGAGDDTLNSAGGADVLYGGSGNDVIVVTATTLTALRSPMGSGGNTTQLARIDGGTGIDTLKLEGAGLNLDLTTIANQGAATPGSSSRLESIERIDITGSGNNTLTIGLRDVIDLASFNTFNNTTGWADGSYNLATGGPGGANPEQRRQLVIDADTGDVVNISGWTSVGTISNGGRSFNVYHQGAFAELIIDTRATVIPG